MSLILQTALYWPTTLEPEQNTVRVRESGSPPYPPLSPAAHYPCHTEPGPTWHGLVDLIELDIPTC